MSIRPHAIARFALGTWLTLVASAGVADETQVRGFVDSIKSVAMVKKEIRTALTESCGTGHCWNVNATRVCDLVAGLDAKVDYLITGSQRSEQPQPEIAISGSDIKLMKMIFSQCKPTNYQYWSFGRILHVHYAPSAKVGAEVNRRLGIRNGR